MRIDLFLLGGVRYRVGAAHTAEASELLRSGSFSIKEAKRVEKTGDFCFSLSKAAAKRFEGMARRQDIAFCREGEAGIPWLWQGLRVRPGLLCGIVLALLLLLSARLVVWDVRILDAQQIPAEELCDELADLGLYAGRFLPTLDRDELALSLRREDARLSFVSINVKGTVAYVQVRESVQLPLQEVERLPANLVAARDGVITLPLIFEGECLVEAGEVVRAGDLLAGGLIDTQNHGYRVTRAAGQVLAKTTHTFRVSVPFTYEEKMPSGKQRSYLTLLFFDFGQKLFKSTGNPIDNCDIIKETIWLTTPSGKKLPLGYSKITVEKYQTLTQRRDALTARKIALSQLDEQIAAECAACTLLQKTTEVLVTSEGIEVLCTVICEEDIAATAEFTVQP